MQANNTMPQRVKQSTHTIMQWVIAWLLSLALLRFGPEHIWDYSIILSSLAIVLNLSIGIKLIFVNKKHLDALDELQRRVQLNAMGITLGVTVVLGAVYGLLETIQLISSSPSPADLLFVIGITYIISSIIGHRYYA